MIIKNLDYEKFRAELRARLENLMFEEEEPSRVAVAFNNGLRCMENTASTLLMEIWNRQHEAEREVSE